MASPDDDREHPEIFSALERGSVTDITEIIVNDPSTRTFYAIASSFVEVALKHPTAVVDIANTIHIASTDPKTFDLDITQPVMQARLHEALYEMLIEAPHESRGMMKPPAGYEYQDLSPQNVFYVSALISGACFRAGLFTSRAQLMMVAQGLQLPGTGWQEVIKPREISAYVVHACLVLLVAGSSMQYGYEEMGALQDRFGPALWKIHNEGLLDRYPPANELLWLTIQESERGFTGNLEVEDIWSTLFPGDCSSNSE